MAPILRGVERLGARVQYFSGPFLARLPLYNPDFPDRTDEARELVSAFKAADAVLIGTPAYHAGISGLVKNAIDYTEDLRADARPYLHGRPVGIVVTSAGWQGGGVTLTSVRTIVHALRGWPTPMGIIANTLDSIFGPAGEILDPKLSEQLDILARTLVEASGRLPL